MDSHRSRARRPVPAEDPEALRAEPVSAGADSSLPDESLWRRVAALPQRQREAVVLKYVVDLDHSAIAAALETTPAMSRRLVSDALAALRKDQP